MNTTEVAQPTTKPNYFERLKSKWGLKSNMQLVMVLLTFSLTGSTVAFLRKTIFNWFGFDTETAMWLKTITYLVCVFPLYQVLILIYGFLLGQFEFFWNYEKRMIDRMFRRKKKA